MMGNALYYWITTIVYVLLVIVLGFISWNKARSKSPTGKILDFWIASRELPGWRLAVSLTSGWLMLGWLGYGISMVYQMGLSGAWMLFIPWFILCFIIIWMVPFVRRLPAISLPEALAKRFGPDTRFIFALCSIFVFTSWTGAELYMMGHLGAPFLNVPPVAVMVVVLIPIMLYTFFGGFRADVLTDVLQFLLMAPFIVILAIVGLSAAGGTSQGDFLGRLATTATPYYGAGSMFRLFACGIAMPVILLFAYLPGWMVEQDLLQRMQAARNLKEAYRMAYFSFIGIAVFVLIFPLLIAFSALILFPPGLESSSAAIGGDATGIISAIIIKYFPVWGQILMLVGILASQMSTVDTFANVTAMPLSYDLVQPLFLRKASRTVALHWTRILAVVAILLGFVYAINATSLMDVYILSSGVLTASIAIPAFAIFWRKANKLGVILSAVLGFAGNVVFYIFEYHVWKHNFQPKWFADTYLGYIIVGLIGSVIGLIIGSLAGKPSSAEELATVAPRPLEGMEIFDYAKEPQP